MSPTLARHLYFFGMVLAIGSCSLTLLTALFTRQTRWVGPIGGAA